MDALQTAMLRSRLTPRRANTLEELTRCRALVNGLKKNPMDAPALPPSPPITDEIKIIMDRLAAIEVRLHQLSQADERARRTPSILDIKHTICRRYGVTIGEIDSPQHDAKLVRPRHIAMYLAHRLTLKSLPAIGRGFGGRDHTTIISAKKKIAKMRAEDPAFAEELAELERALAGPPK